MKIRFKASPSRLSYWSESLRFNDGETAEVGNYTADMLIRSFPTNFEEVALSLGDLGKPLHKPLKLSGITILTVHYKLATLKKSLLSYLPKEVEFIKLDNRNNRWHSMAKALNYGIRRAKNDLIICAHEDVRFGEGWFSDFIAQECRLKEWGTLGITGFTEDGRILWGSDHDTPQEIALLDDCCIILNRRNGIWFDEKTFTGWHRYGIDFCFQCHEANLGVYIITGLAYHDCVPENHSKEWRDQRETAH
ncbi:unnamed protein product, partial [marine sediment metagenome]